MGRLKGRKKEQGVTLVELMIVVAILGMVMAAMYNMFEFQQLSYTTQDNVAVMQQNVRVGLEYMVKGIRMAGYIPEGIPPNNSAPTTDVTTESFSDAGNVSETIEEATANFITFQADIDDDGSTETVRYALNGTDLTREVWKWNGGWGASGGQPIVAEDIESIEFTYTLLADDSGLDNDNDDDGDGDEDEDGELMTWDFGTGALNTTQLRSYIRRIRLIMIARAPNPDSKYIHPTQGDHYRRRTLSSNISLRNMK